MYRAISKCRVCGNSDLTPIIDLGNQALTGVFPRTKTEKVTVMPLQLVMCTGDPERVCGLVQLRHTGDFSEMYGKDYGYRSGLNGSMVRHLHDKVRSVQKRIELKQGDLVIDIGSNDSTLLQAYPKCQATLVGIDPTGTKFSKYYPDHIQLIPEFFPSQTFERDFGSRKAKVITSCAMLYDLEDPQAFFVSISNRLADDGIWVTEQSYMPTMLKVNSYDTICHEHLEYYGLRQIAWLANRAGLRIIDVEFNDVNGGSFSVMLCKVSSKQLSNASKLEAIFGREKGLKLDTTQPFELFRARIETEKARLLDFVSKQKKLGKVIFGYGASTKGNVLLQYCGLTESQITCIGEVNETKFGCFTPGTLIPIIPEAEAKKLKPDYFLVLPWHFRGNILARESASISTGAKFIFPLPSFDIASGNLKIAA